MNSPRIEMSDAAPYWQNVWTTKRPEEVSRHQVEEAREEHLTPEGAVLPFQWARFVRR